MKKIILLLTICLPLLFCGCVKKIVDITVTIYGTVVDKDTQKALEGVHIQLSPGTYTKHTGSDGYYEFVDIPARQYDIYARKEGYQEDHTSINPNPGESREIIFMLKKIAMTEE